jgi:hypothetical protein
MVYEVWIFTVLQQYVDSVVFDCRPVERFEEPLLRVVGFVGQEVRRPVCAFWLQKSAAAHEGAVFADVDFECSNTKHEIFDFVIDLSGNKQQIEERHGEQSFQWRHQWRWRGIIMAVDWNVSLTAPWTEVGKWSNGFVLRLMDSCS